MKEIDFLQVTLVYTDRLKETETIFPIVLLNPKGTSEIPLFFCAFSASCFVSCILPVYISYVSKLG